MASTSITNRLRYVDFEHAEFCTNCDPISCTVAGEVIPCIGNWRDLVVAFLERYVVSDPERIAWLSSHSLKRQGTRCFLLLEKPKFYTKQISSGHWVNLDTSIAGLVTNIGDLCGYCGIDLESVRITYRPKESVPESFEDSPEGVVVPESVMNILRMDYAKGFRFDGTVLRLVSEKAQVKIDDEMQKALKSRMFCRSDNLYFLPDFIAKAEVRGKIVKTAGEWLDQYGFFELSELYAQFVGCINAQSIDNLEHFIAFYRFLEKREIRCVEFYQTKLARVNRSVKDLSSDLASKIVRVVSDDNNGTINEYTLKERFPGFSDKTLALILKEHAELLVQTEINDVICYQTLETLGLPEAFSEKLTKVLEQIDALDIPPSVEVLHTALSLYLGVNFRKEYNIQNDKIFRKLMEMYYNQEPQRKWFQGVFSEVSD